MGVEQDDTGEQQETVRQQLTSWRDDAEAFGDSLTGFLRVGDRTAFIILLDEMSHDAVGLLSSEREEAGQEMGTLLDRLTRTAAAAVGFGERRLFESCVRTTFTVYMSGFDERGDQRNTSTSGGRMSSPLLWYELAKRIIAVGGLAVRRGDWGAVRQLALQMTTDRISVSYGEGQYWLRHAAKEADNTGIVDTSDANRRQGGWLVNGALEIVEREPYLRPDLPAGDHRLLQSLLGFDLLVTLVVSADVGVFDTGKAYPSFIYWNLYEVEPLLASLLRDGGMRAGVFPGGVEDAFLARVLRNLGRAAGRRSGLWSEWGKAVSDFLSRHPDPDSAR